MTIVTMVLPKAAVKRKRGPVAKLLVGTVIIIAIYMITSGVQESNSVTDDDEAPLLSRSSSALRTKNRGGAVPDQANFVAPDQLQSYTYDSEAPVKFIPSTRNVLEYVHITKTGGTAVEEAGAKAGIAWGICHFEPRKELGEACMKSDWRNDAAFTSFQKRNSFNGEWWHSPPAWLSPNPYQYTKSFTVARNPYDRIISEYYCKYFGFHKGEYYGKLDRGPKRANRDDEKSEWLTERGTNNVQLRSFLSKNRAEAYQQRVLERQNTQGKHMGSRKDRRSTFLSQRASKTTVKSSKLEEEGDPENGIMQRRLQAQSPDHPRGLHLANLARVKQAAQTGEQTSSIRRGLRREDSPSTLNNWIRSTLRQGIRRKTGHTLPQHYYVYSGLTQVIPHVLHFENLQADFRDLMERYGLDALIPENKTNAGHESSTTVRLTAEHLEPATIALINKFYAKDFELFGYDLMPS